MATSVSSPSAVASASSPLVCRTCLVTAALVDALRRQSETDPLTLVANRADFQRLAHQVLASAARRGEPVALVLCDVDGLKLVNDTGGHAAGDAVLTGMVSSWQEVLRGNDVIARLGGDEFAVLMPATSAAGAQASVDRLRAATDKPFNRLRGRARPFRLPASRLWGYARRIRWVSDGRNLHPRRQPGHALGE